MQKQNEPPAAPAPIRGRKPAITRDSVVEEVEVVCKDVDVTPTSCSSSAKTVSIQVGGKIVASINDGVDYGQPDFEEAIEHVATADDDVDFGVQDNDHAEENEEPRKVGGLPKKKKSVTLDVVSVVDPNVLRDIALREIEEKDHTETGDRCNSGEEGLEIDLHNSAVRPHVKLGVPNNELENSTKDGTDTEDLDVEYIDNSIGEAWGHMRAPGTAMPGLQDEWMLPKEHDNWGGYVPWINSGAPVKDNIDNPGGWNLYSFTPKYEKGKYINHQTPTGAIVVPENSEGKRCDGN